MRQSLQQSLRVVNYCLIQGSHSNERIKIQDFFSTIKTRKTHRRTKPQAPELL